MLITLTSLVNGGARNARNYTATDALGRELSGEIVWYGDYHVLYVYEIDGVAGLYDSESVTTIARSLWALAITSAFEQIDELVDRSDSGLGAVVKIGGAAA